MGPARRVPPTFGQLESHVAAGLNMEEEEEGEVEAKAEKGPTRELFLAHKNKTHQSEAVACETVPCGLRRSDT